MEQFMSGKMLCENTSDCPSIVLIKSELAQMRVDSQSAKEATLENTKQLYKTEVATVKMTAEMQHLGENLKEYKNNNKEEHNTFFKRLREQERKISEGENQTVTKLSIYDIAKIITPLIAVCTTFLFFLSYMKK